MKDQPLELNGREVLVIIDRIKNDDKEDNKPIAKPLLVKLASVYLETLPDSKQPVTVPVTLNITEPEAWLLRSKISSTDRSEEDARLGIKLLRKLYTIIIHFDNGRDYECGTVEDERYIDALNRLQEDGGLADVR